MDVVFQPLFLPHPLFTASPAAQLRSNRWSMGRNRKFVPTIKLVGLPPLLIPISRFFLNPQNSTDDASVDFWGLVWAGFCVGG